MDKLELVFELAKSDKHARSRGHRISGEAGSPKNQGESVKNAWIIGWLLQFHIYTHTKHLITICYRV